MRGWREVRRKWKLVEEGVRRWEEDDLLPSSSSPTHSPTPYLPLLLFSLPLIPSPLSLQIILTPSYSSSHLHSSSSSLILLPIFPPCSSSSNLLLFISYSSLTSSSFVSPNSLFPFFNLLLHRLPSSFCSSSPLFSPQLFFLSPPFPSIIISPHLSASLLTQTLSSPSSPSLLNPSFHLLSPPPPIFPTPPALLILLPSPHLSLTLLLHHLYSSPPFFLPHPPTLLLHPLPSTHSFPLPILLLPASSFYHPPSCSFPPSPPPSLLLYPSSSPISSSLLQ